MERTKQFVDSRHHLSKQDLTPWQDFPGHAANLLDLETENVMAHTERD